MPRFEITMTDIANWVKSLLTPVLWDRYCHLSYAQMAQVPELSEYVIELREANRMWLRASRAGCLKSIPPFD